MNDHYVVVEEGTFFNLFGLGDRQLLGLDHDLLKGADGNLVIRAEDEAVVCLHILGDAELGVDVVLHIVAVAVQMVGGDVQQYGDVGFEVVHSVELEAADLEDIDVVVLGSDLQGVTLADVSAQSGVHPGFLEQVVDKGRGSGLAVAAGDAYFLRIVVPSGEFYL